jgi:hypothetical protein
VPTLPPSLRSAVPSPPLSLRSAVPAAGDSLPLSAAAAAVPDPAPSSSAAAQPGQPQPAPAGPQAAVSAAAAVAAVDAAPTAVAAVGAAAGAGPVPGEASAWVGGEWAGEVWGTCGAPGPGTRVVLVGLDGTGILGRDGGGLGVAAQLAGAAGRARLAELYARLTNPAVAGLVRAVEGDGRGAARFGVWARRRGLVRYRSAVRGEEIALRWRAEWHLSDDTFVIPSSVGDAEEVMAAYAGDECLLRQVRTRTAEG